MNRLLPSRHVRCLFAGMAMAAQVQAAPLPAFEEVKAAYVPSTSLLLDRRGVLLSPPAPDAASRRPTWVALRDLSPALQSALIASEDRRFYTHGGVDWQAFVGALWDNLWRSAGGLRPRGASTLTMQLAGLLDPALQARGSARTLAQKWDQAMAAREMERRWTKQQIIEAYLNLATFRAGLQGVYAASVGLFAKHPSGLDMGEGVLLAALLRGPNAPTDKVAQRACAVARQLPQAPACEVLRTLAAGALSGRQRIDTQDHLAPHLARTLLTAPGMTVTTTLDAELQRFARDTLHSHLSAAAGRSLEDGAVMVLDNRSGEVLAYVGGSAEPRDGAVSDGVTSPRPAGPMRMPFLYELAIGRRLLTAASIVEDVPAGLTMPADSDVAHNVGQELRGPVSVRTALGASLELSALRTLALVGTDTFQERLRALELNNGPRGGDLAGHALVVGTAPASLASLTNAYRALATGGEWRPWRPTADHTGMAPRRAMHIDAAFIVADILADQGTRAQMFGAQHPLSSRIWAAVKAGASTNLRNGWCVGFSERYTVGVWMGARASMPARQAVVTGAVAIWREVMHNLHRQLSSTPPRMPAGVLTRTVRFESSVEATRSELFLVGTQTPRADVDIAARETLVAPRIVYPGDRMVIGLEPDVSESRQRIYFHSRPAIAGTIWLLDGEAVSDGNEHAGWTPTAGRHVLQLATADGEVLDSVSFEVRAAARPGPSE